jgi:hypothetical protein
VQSRVRRRPAASQIVKEDNMTKWMRSWLAVAVLAAAIVPIAGCGAIACRVVEQATVHELPGGREVGAPLPAGTPVTKLDQDDGWANVEWLARDVPPKLRKRTRGWILLSTLHCEEDKGGSAA